MIRFSGAYIEGASGGTNNLYYDSSKTKGTLGFTPYSFTHNLEAVKNLFKACDYSEDEQRLYSFTLKDNVAAGYMRFTLLGDGADAIVTVNEEIV